MVALDRLHCTVCVVSAHDNVRSSDNFRSIYPCDRPFAILGGQDVRTACYRAKFRVRLKPALEAVGSATVAVLSQSSGIERSFYAMRRGHVVDNNCALYMLLYKQQCRGFYYSI